MKKLIHTFFIISILLFTSVSADTDTQLIDIENQSKPVTKELNIDFSLNKFSSCQNMQDVVTEYIKNSFSHSFQYKYRSWIDFWIQGESLDTITPSSNVAESKQVESSESMSFDDYSSTNIQVVWVDEWELIKTDWKNVYFFNSKNYNLYIAQFNTNKELSIIKTIKIPKSFVNPELYVSWNKLIIIASKYSEWNYDYYWFDRKWKTAVVIYNISNINKLTIDKYYEVDWSNMKSRLVWNYLYILSKVNFYFPYNIYYQEWTESLDSNSITKDFNINKIIPKKTELRRSSNKSEQNVKSKWKSIPYNLSRSTVWDCTSIEYIMPDKESIKKYNFNPSYVVISSINIEDSFEKVNTKMLFGDVSEIYMSLKNLYITSNLYVNYDFHCPIIKCVRAPCDAQCIMPYYYRWENTLTHKLNISWANLNYTSSNIVPWRPLNQYSMDENKDHFRIITSWTYPKRNTNLFILDKDLKLTWSLTNLAPDENFQSSRFIWDKLYLVTFEQIDPLFVIDVSDNTNPKVLWELKIPWYSTYLHPYDSNNLIWLWFNTSINKWWWTVNDWLKIDLYDVSDFKNPIQKYSLNLWDKQSYSEVLNNPRLFVWNSNKNLLFLPAMLYTNAKDENDSYRNKDVFQWTIVVKIDKNSWITEQARITHIDSTWLEQKRKEECAKLTSDTNTSCKKLIDWREYCPPSYNYIPPYCYADSPIWEYLANQIWNFNNDFIIRNLYLDNILLTLSNNKIQSNDINSNFQKLQEVKMD